MQSLAHLTQTDKEILQNSWKVVSRDMQSLAEDIFQMIFEQAPDAKLLFTFMLKESANEEKKSNEFSFHALRFIQVIESTMTHLDNPQTLDSLFLNLGKIHARHEEHLGFSSHYWSVFKECVLFHFRKAMHVDKLGSKQKRSSKRTIVKTAEIDSAIILWREVLRFIISKMKIGLESNGIIRRANRIEVINGMYENKDGHDMRCPDTKTTQVSQALRRTELSVIVPDYFIRRKSEEISPERLDTPNK